MWAHAYVDRIALEVLQVVERPEPEPEWGQIVIRLEAVALNYRDLAIARGNYHIGVAPPLVPLSEAQAWAETGCVRLPAPMGSFEPGGGSLARPDNGRCVGGACEERRPSYRRGRVTGYGERSVLGGTMFLLTLHARAGP